MPIIEIHTSIKAEKHIVFDLSRSIDIHEFSMLTTNEKAVSGRTSGLIELNEQVTWRAKHLGIYQELTSKITEMRASDYFVDEMVKGAFKHFRHEHYFETRGETTLMTDIFDYTSPFGYLGIWVDRLFLEKYMTRLPKLRNHTIKQLSENGDWKKILQK